MAAMEHVSESSQTKGPLVVAVVAVLLFISTLMVGPRIVSRTLVRQFTLDDFFAIASWASIIACGVTIASMTQHGLGRHLENVSGENMIIYLRSFWISILAYTIALILIKLTFLLHYLRLLSISGMRNACIGAIVVVVLWAISQLIGIFVECIPLDAAWDKRVQGNCMPNALDWWYFNGIFNLVSDIAVIMLPLPDLWKLRLPRGQKIYLMGVFGLGFFTVIVSIIRLQWLQPEEDVTWWNVTPALWSVAEITSALSCACLPFLKPFAIRLTLLFTKKVKCDKSVHLHGESSKADTESHLVERQPGQEEKKKLNSVGSDHVEIDSTT